MKRLMCLLTEGMLCSIIRIGSFYSDRTGDYTSVECRHTKYARCDFSSRRCYLNVSTDQIVVNQSLVCSNCGVVDD